MRSSRAPPLKLMACS